MTLVDNPRDPRPQFALALDQVERLVDALEPEDSGRPTPCAEYDVRTLLAHLVAVLRKLRTVKDGGDMTQVADPAEDLSGDEDEAFRQARAELEQVWAAASNATLGASYTLVWGTMTGRELLDAYTHEFTVHAWDLSQATGRGDKLDPNLAEAALDWYSQNIPAEGRSDSGPFADPVSAPDDADPYTRLAAYLGRST